MIKYHLLFYALIIIFVVWYHRPLQDQQLIDPGIEYFTLPERELPSSWELFQDYSISATKGSEDRLVLGQVNDILNKGELITFSTRGPERYIDHVDWTGVILVFSGEVAEEIQRHIDTISSYMSGTELYPPSYRYDKRSPLSFHQITRLGSLYTTFLCHQGQHQQCVSNFKILWNLSQQSKKEGEVIALLRGAMQESYVIQHILYFAEQGYAIDSLKDMLRKEQYCRAYECLRLTIQGEFAMFQHMVNDGKAIMTMSYIDTWKENNWLHSWLHDLSQLILSRLFDILFDKEETMSFARKYYYMRVKQPELLTNVSNDTHAISNFWATGPMLGRKNSAGYVLLLNALPGSASLPERLYRQETQLKELLTH